VAPPGSTAAASGDAKLGIDQVIEAALDAIQPGLAAGALDQNVRALCGALVEARASGVVLSACLERLNAKLKSSKLGVLNKTEWSRQLKAAAAAFAVNHPQGAADEGESALRTWVRDVFPGDPIIPADLVVPAGWKLTPDGVYRTTAEMDVEITPTPLIIVERQVNDADGTENVKMAWRRDGGWRLKICPREVVANRRDIAGLAGFGLPVTSGTADEVVAYLAAFEAENLAALPRTQVRRQMGWVDDRLSGFLWGRTLIRAETLLAGEEAEAPAGGGGQSLFAAPGAAAATGAAVGSPAEHSGHVISFQGADVGDEQVASGFHASGSFAGWRAAVEPALGYPRFRLVMASSLSAPVLSIVRDEGAKNFSIDVSGETSRGKTTTLRAAASAWGNADEKSSTGAAISTWNTTRVGVERGAGLLNGLPIVRDDTKLARKPEDVAQVLYDVAAGRTRDRGSLKGLDRTVGFTTVMLLSGESRAVSFSGDGGTRARVLTLWGSPFDRADCETRSLVNLLNSELLEHYGHAGPRFVKYLLGRRADWPAWRARYRQIRAEYQEKAAANAVVGRLGDALAVITLAGELAAEALDMPVLAKNPIDALWTVLTAEAAEADRASQALLHVWDWAIANGDKFFPRQGSRFDGDRADPPNGWAGHWDRHGTSGPWRFLGFVQNQLRKILEEASYDFDAVVSAWKDRNWLLVDGSDKAHRFHQVVLGGERARVIAITREAVDGIGIPTRAVNQDLLRLQELCRWFLTGMQKRGPQMGDGTARTQAITAAQAYLRSLVSPSGNTAPQQAHGSAAPVGAAAEAVSVPTNGVPQTA
jgi:hypothetical protein